MACRHVQPSHVQVLKVGTAKIVTTQGRTIRFPSGGVESFVGGGDFFVVVVA